MLSHAAVLVVVVAAAASVRAGTPSAAAYPALDKVPPVNNQWSSAFIKNVPDLKVNSAQLPSPDWSADVTTCVGQKTWGLSYDDGPGPYTDDLLAQQLKKRTSRSLPRWCSARIIKETIGVTPKYMRPPYGDIDDRAAPALDGILAGGYKVVPVEDCVGAAPYDESFWSAGSRPVVTNTAVPSAASSSSSTMIPTSTSSAVPITTSAQAAPPVPVASGDRGSGTTKGSSNGATDRGASAFLALVSLAVAAAAML
ncbi:chitin deacetylase [Polyrhizophydium stewartii]|uniref:Chitin deacetylase n=1 Tax=Polyrhizophydium stewartii TaxID=2732419 RepID=A0ABR4NFX6_9FUNG